jgi:hypothetical protein
MNLDLRTELQRFGATPESVKLFAAPDACLVRYLDLLPGNTARIGTPEIPLPTGVIEYDRQPLLYLFPADTLAGTPRSNREKLGALLRRLACRGEGEYVGFVKPGELTLYPITLGRRIPQGLRISASDARAPMLVHDLAGGLDDFTAAHADGAAAKPRASHADTLHRLLVQRLMKVSETLRHSDVFPTTLAPDPILPLVIRALMMRVLMDRGVINADTLTEAGHPHFAPEACFSTPAHAALTCAWLDRHFSGDVLPLFGDAGTQPPDYLAFFEEAYRQSDTVFHALSTILRRAADGHLSRYLDWPGIDFAHVPIGLLSEVIEDFIHRLPTDGARNKSARYIPRGLADFIVSQAWDGTAQDRRQHVRALDPAVGTGTFLVSAYQRLVGERWAATGTRPTTPELRKILFQQIRGFDSNPTTLAAAAISLSLTALALDPSPDQSAREPYPDRLLGSVLHDTHKGSVQVSADNSGSNSLSRYNEQAQDRHRYDIVIGHSPMPSEHDDLAPVWRARRWAAPSGIIACVLPVGLLFKRTKQGIAKRTDLFYSLHVTGILNGSELLPFWPGLHRPFCILFCRNEVPAARYRFHFVAPNVDTVQTSGFRLHIDPESIQPIDTALLSKKDYLLKSLVRGGRFDIELIDRLHALTMWERPDPEESEETAPAPVPPRAVRLGDIRGDGHRKLARGQGFVAGTPSEAHRLVALEGNYLARETPGLRINADDLPAFPAQRLFKPRGIGIYKPPLVLIPEHLHQDGIRARLYLGETPLIYDRSYYGYSTQSHQNSPRLARYLFLLLNSDLFRYFLLQVSASYGVERDGVYAEDSADFPAIAPGHLTENQWTMIESISDQLAIENESSWHTLNDWVNDLYELSAADRQVIRDTLNTRLPYGFALTRARRPATELEIEQFRSALEDQLQPFFEITGERLAVRRVPLPVTTWVAFDLTTTDHDVESSAEAAAVLAESLTNQEGASRMMIDLGAGRLRVALRNQYRNLTKTQARLCALDVLRSHGRVFPVRAA